MNKSINFEMIILAREARGLTQRELAEKLSVSQGQLSKIESGVQEIPDTLLSKLSSVLDYPEHFFALSERIYGPGTGELFHRKRQSLSQRVMNKIHAEINIRRMHISKFLQGVELENKFHFHNASEFDSPPDIARAVRASWQAGLPPGRPGPGADLSAQQSGLRSARNSRAHQRRALQRCQLPSFEHR